MAEPRRRDTGRVDADEIARYVAAELPEFREVVEQHVDFFEEALTIILFGELADRYAQRETVTPELARRFWATMEHVAVSDPASGAGEAAVHQGLVEFLAWGDRREMTALLDAEPYLGPETRRIVGYYLADWPNGSPTTLRLLAEERAR